MRRLLLLVLVLAVFWPAAAQAAPPVARAAATCDDYDNQADAQRAKDTRDADGDGVYCEALPCPCARPGSGGGGGGGTDEPAPEPRPAPRPKPKPEKRARTYSARITSVVDGDTIKVRLTSGGFETVRLIGIDTPETKNPEVPVECGGPEATSNMLSLSFTAPEDGDGDGLLDLEGGDGRRVTLRTDPTQDTRDRYGRLLAYVSTLGGNLLQTAQLAAGWAETDVFDGEPFDRVARFRKAQRSARVASRGVWADCGGNFDRPADDATATASAVRLCGDIVDIGVTPTGIRATDVSWPARGRSPSACRRCARPPGRAA